MTNPLAYDEGRHAFHCLCCMEIIEISWRAMRNPEKFSMLRQMAEIDHKECGEYDNPVLARNSRMFRKRMNAMVVNSEH